MSNVNHPSHYNSGKIEVIDFIEDQQLDFSLGNAVKYICRAGKKSSSTTVEDLEKAIWYLADKVNRLKPIAPDTIDPDIIARKVYRTSAESHPGCRSCNNFSTQTGCSSLVCKTCEASIENGVLLTPSNWRPKENNV